MRMQAVGSMARWVRRAESGGAPHELPKPAEDPTQRQKEVAGTSGGDRRGDTCFFFRLSFSWLVGTE